MHTHIDKKKLEPETEDSRIMPHFLKSSFNVNLAHFFEKR